MLLFGVRFVISCFAIIGTQENEKLTKAYLVLCLFDTIAFLALLHLWNFQSLFKYLLRQLSYGAFKLYEIVWCGFEFAVILIARIAAGIYFMFVLNATNHLKIPSLASLYVANKDRWLMITDNVWIMMSIVVGWVHYMCLLFKVENLHNLQP